MKPRAFRGLDGLWEILIPEPASRIPVHGLASTEALQVVPAHDHIFTQNFKLSRGPQWRVFRYIHPRSYRRLRADLQLRLHTSNS